MNRRRSRIQRKPGVRIALNARDEAVVRGLARFRIATTRQLARLYFAGVRTDTVTARLRRLFNGQVLDIVAAGVNVENVYGLGPEARRWLEDRGIASGPVPRGTLQHHLAIVDLWTRLAAALHGRREVRLAKLVPDWDCRAASSHEPPAVVPDATIDLVVERPGRASQTVRIFAEVDLGTERHGALKRKLETYAVDRLVEGAGLAVVLSGAGSQRTAAVGRLVADYWPSWSVVCSAEEWPAPLLSGQHLRMFDPLSGSAHGEGRAGAVSPSAHASSARRGDPLSPEDSRG
jgi:hypothetical protein